MAICHADTSFFFALMLLLTVQVDELHSCHQSSYNNLMHRAQLSEFEFKVRHGWVRSPASFSTTHLLCAGLTSSLIAT